MIHLKLIMMALLWAGGFIAAKSIAFQAGPFTISFLRFLVVTIVLALLVYKKEKYPKFNAGLLIYVLCAAFLGEFCYNYFFFAGMRYIDAGRGSVIISTVPIVVSVVSVLMLKEKAGIQKMLGVVLSLFGAWIVISNGQIEEIVMKTIGRGEVYLVLCVFCAAAFTLLSKQILHHLSPMMTMLTISAFGTAFLLIPAVIETRQIPIEFTSYSFILNMLYLSIGPSVIAVIFYYQAIKKVGPSRASQYMNLIPVFSVILAFVFLGEQITGSLIVGGGFVTTGLWFANLTT